MSYLVWKDSFNIGVQEMDKQHRQFVGYINELYESLQSGDAECTVAPLLDKFTEYVQVHFTAEEKFMKSIGYPMIDFHMKQHAYYVSEIGSMKGSLLNDTQKAHHMLLFLKDWLLHHIMSEDMNYAEQSVRPAPGPGH